MPLRSSPLASLALLLATLGGCAGESDRDREPLPVTPMEVTTLCRGSSGVIVPKEWEAALGALTPAPSIDGVAFFSRESDGRATSRGEIGTPCKSAPDVAACRASLVTRANQMASESSPDWLYEPPSMGNSGGDTSTFALATRDRDVIVPVTSLPLLRDVVAPIETIDEAVTWSLLSRLPGPTCAEGVNARVTPDFFEHRAVLETCRNAGGGSAELRIEHVVRTRRDGEVQRFERELSRSALTGGATCPIH